MTRSPPRRSSSSPRRVSSVRRSRSSTRAPTRPRWRRRSASTARRRSSTSTPTGRCPARSPVSRSRRSSPSTSPMLVLFVQSYDGRDALARLSVRLDAPVLTNGMSLSLDGDTLVFGTAIFGGTTLVDVKLTAGGPALDRDPPEVVRRRAVGWRCRRGRRGGSRRRGPCRGGEGARALRGGAARTEARRGGGRRVRWPRARFGRELQAARRGARQAAQGRVRRVAARSSTRAGFRTRCRSARPARR